MFCSGPAPPGQSHIDQWRCIPWPSLLIVRVRPIQGKPQIRPIVYYRRLPESALADRRLSRSALAVLAQLDGFARDKAECWPSVKTLAEALGLCRRTIQLALTRLKSCGYIAEKPASNPTGRVLVLLWKTGGAKPLTPGAQAPVLPGPPEGRKLHEPDKKPVFGRKESISLRSLQNPRTRANPPGSAPRAPSYRGRKDGSPPRMDPRHLPRLPIRPIPDRPSGRAAEYLGQFSSGCNNPFRAPLSRPRPVLSERAHDPNPAHS